MKKTLILLAAAFMAVGSNKAEGLKRTPIAHNQIIRHESPVFRTSQELEEHIESQIMASQNFVLLGDGKRLLPNNPILAPMQSQVSNELKEKLDSVAGPDYTDIITYDEERQFVKSLTRRSNNENYTQISEYDYMIDDFGGILLTLSRVSQFFADGTISGTTLRYEYDSKGRTLSYEYVNWKDEDTKENIISGNRDEYKRRDDGVCISQTHIYLGIGGSSAYTNLSEYEYYENVVDNLLITKSITQSNTDDSKKLVPYTKTYYALDGKTQAMYYWNGSDWSITFEQYFDDSHRTLTQKEYDIVNGESRLMSCKIEHRMGSADDFNTMPLLYYENKQFDIYTGEVTDGQKEVYLHEFFLGEIAQYHYMWDTITKDWTLTEYYELMSGYEGAQRTIVDDGYNTCIYEGQVYHNGQWETSWHSERQYQCEYQINPNNRLLSRWVPVRCLMTLIYDLDLNTGEYTSYEKSVYGYDDNGRATVEEYYTAPDVLSSFKEYSYNADGSINGCASYKVVSGTLVLDTRSVYEYDNEVLCSEVLGLPGTLTTNIAAVLPSNYYVKKPLSIKVYSADGNLISTEWEFFYSSLDQQSRIAAARVPEHEAVRFYNLQGQPMQSRKGQIMINDQQKKIMVK